jgi:ferredoxin-type protein NapH
MYKITKYRYLILRRIIQISLLLLFAGSNYFNWTILKGNFSAAKLFATVPLSDPYAVLQMLFAGFLAASDIIIGAAIIFLIYALLSGRMFCSWVCPINIVSDLAISIRKKTGISPSLTFSRKTRYGVLILGLLLSMILGFAAFEAISPISILHRGIIYGIGAGWSVILALFLFEFAVMKDGWCGHLCPLGAFYALIGRFSIIKVKHDMPKCTNCMACFAVCPEEQVLNIVGKESGFIKSSECTNCSRCIEVCDDNALKLSLRKSLK